MTVVAVLGGGGGGRSAATELTLAGHDVRLWNRRPETIELISARGSIEYEGVFGAGTVAPQVITSDLRVALSGASVIVICLPSIAHHALFEDLAAMDVHQPIVLNPGHTGGALHARETWRRQGSRMPAMAELSTLTYVARIHDEILSISGRAETVRGAALPGGSQALEAAMELFPGVAPVENVLASSLSNVNLVLHPPGAILGLSWVEATHGSFTFYVDGITPSVGRVLETLDAERLAVADRFGIKLPTLLEEMQAIGTADGTGTNQLIEAIRGGEANRSILAPDSTSHRYYREDFPFGLLPFTELARTAGVDVPLARSLLAVARAAIGEDLLTGGLDADRLGIADLDGRSLLDSVC